MIRFEVAKLIEKVWPGSFDFSTDGCTGVPDGAKTECCAEHDFYYRNDVGVPRWQADLWLAECVRKVEGLWSAIGVYLGVTIFGVSSFKGYEDAMNWFDDDGYPEED